MLQQYFQQFQRLLLNPDFHPRFAQLSRLERNLKSSEPHNGRVLR
jgi:hypothetical protein